MSFDFCTAFLKSIFNFEHYEKRYEPHSLCFSEIIDRANRGYVNIERVAFQYTLGQLAY